MTACNRKIALAIALVLVLIGGIAVTTGNVSAGNRIHVTAYFPHSNGIYVGDDIRVLGVRVGSIDTIEARPENIKITFWVDDKYPVPAEAKAVIISPSLVSARAIQLVPAYVGGPALQDHAEIPSERTAVPVEWDDLRVQLEKLAEALQPTEPGGVSTLGALVTTAADNLRGEGANIHATIEKLSKAFSALGDHSGDLFSTIKDLSAVVSALQDSKDLMRQLNQNLAATTTLLSDQPDEIGAALGSMNDVVRDVQAFAADNRETVGTTSDRLASISVALHESLADIKQTLHLAPTQIANFANIYPPAQGGFAGAFSLNNFANPIQFLCGAIQAAARLNAEQSAKLCVQYLAPIVKNRQYNFPPLGVNPIVGAVARPNEITYSEDWLRPDYIPPPDQAPPPPNDGETQSISGQIPLPAPMLPAEGAAVPPSDLEDMLMPSGAGS